MCPWERVRDRIAPEGRHTRIMREKSQSRGEWCSIAPFSFGASAVPTSTHLLHSLASCALSLLPLPLAASCSGAAKALRVALGAELRQETKRSILTWPVSRLILPPTLLQQRSEQETSEASSGPVHATGLTAVTKEKARKEESSQREQRGGTGRTSANTRQQCSLSRRAGVRG